MPVTTLSKSVIDALTPPASGNVVYWDRDVTGLGARITAAGHVSFVYRYVVSGRERRFTFGDYGQSPGLTVTAAREMVRKRRFTKDGKPLNPDDPLSTIEVDREARTVAELCARYMEEHAQARKRPASVENDRANIVRYVRPDLGHLKVAEVTPAHVDKLHRSMKATPYQANRVLALLSKMFTLATVRWHYRTDNPCRGVERYHEEKRKRYLTPEELGRLFAVLAAHPCRQSANAIRLCLLTGARSGEVLSATWSQFDVQGGTWTKPSAHTKQKAEHIVPLSGPAVTLLASMTPGAPDAYLFPAPHSHAAPQDSLKTFWRTVRKRAAIPDVRVHDLRHSFASYLASSGRSLVVIGEMLGHTQPATTARYAHVLDATRRQAADAVGAFLSAHETGGERADVVEFRRAG
jgi:integrase